MEKPGMANTFIERPHSVESDVLQLLEPHGIGRMRTYRMGSVLYWQGDPVEQIFVIKRGAIKVSTLSRNGEVHTYGIVGPGRLLGANAYLLGSEHDSIAETLEESEILLVPPGEFERALAGDRRLSAAVMRELARVAHSMTDRMRDLSFLDVQQRLKRSLVRLAREHGLTTADGIRINLKITHEEIGALVAANRTTITACLNELKRQGYLWTEGRRLVIIPPEHMAILDRLSQSIVEGDEAEASRLAQKAVHEGVDPFKALDALTRGIKEIDRSYSRTEIELPDVVLAAFAMKDALPIIDARLQQEHEEVGVVGTVTIGTVHGDIHDIGKTIVAMLLRSRGFRVVDLGMNVTREEFGRAARQIEPDILALSALTNATALEISRVIRYLEEEGIRKKIKVIVGGGAVTERQAEQVGADGYHATARGAVELAWRLCTW
jgi:methylmalonyl-CoA mutase cobalamin-binding domain/chain